MFTGIIKHIGKIHSVKKNKDNLVLTIESEIARDVNPDDSVAHNGVCLTVTAGFAKSYTVTVIEETLSKTNLGNLKKGDSINLEKALGAADMLHGHLVQGHIDGTVECIKILEKKGSWVYRFSYPAKYGNLLIPKGSVCLNGVSLTISNLKKKYFEVSIIPHTYSNTTFQFIQIGDLINIEYDLIGKYLQRYLKSIKKRS